MRSRPRDQFSPNLVSEEARCWRAHNKFEIVGNDARVFLWVLWQSKESVPLFFKENYLNYSPETEPKRKREWTVCSPMWRAWRFRLIRLFPVWCVTVITSWKYCWQTISNINTYVLQFLHVFFPPLPTFKSCDLVTFPSYPSFLFFFEGKLNETKIERNCHCMYVTLNDTRDELACQLFRKTAKQQRFIQYARADNAVNWK